MLGLEEKLRGLLFRLNQAAPEIEASAVVSIDGLMLASALPAGTNDDDVAAIAATLLGLGDRTVQEFRHGNLQQVFVKGEGGYTVITNTGQDNVLVVVTDEKAKLGLILLQIKLAAREIAQSFLHLLDASDQTAPPPSYPG